MIDVEIEEKVLGRVPCDKWRFMSFGSAGGAVSVRGACDHETGTCYPADLSSPWPDYRNNPGAAMTLVNQMKRRGYYVSMQNCCSPEKEWCVIFSNDDDAYEGQGKFCDAVVQAALATVGWSRPEGAPQDGAAL